MKFVTFLNAGCVDICKNMLLSAELVGLNPQDFYIACLDNVAFSEFSKYKNCFLYSNQKHKRYQNWSFDNTSGFRKIVKHKWPVIKKVYEDNRQLCWVDVDIVFRSNPIEYISNKDKVLFQSDVPGNQLCSGFMVFNDSESCKQLIADCASHTEADDQLIVNEIAFKNYNDTIEILDRDLFPNGYAYYTENRKEAAVLVHNNFMIGMETKIQKFKEQGLWYLK